MNLPLPDLPEDSPRSLRLQLRLFQIVLERLAQIEARIHALEAGQLLQLSANRSDKDADSAALFLKQRYEEELTRLDALLLGQVLEAARALAQTDPSSPSYN